MNDINSLLCYFKNSPIRSSNLKITQFIVSYDVVIRSERLSLVMMDESRYQRLQLMDELSNQSLTYKDISKVLNELGIVTPTNRHYTANNVERSLMKYRRREGRRLSEPNITSTETYKICLWETKLGL